MLGSLGPTYKWWIQHLTGGGEKLRRLTGLDPAGPGFVDAYVGADPRLNKARLNHSDATFVDVIHTNAAREGPVLLNLDNPLKMRLGEYGRNGHMDFYPDGGDEQRDCNPHNIKGVCLVACSHRRAVQYFIDSINNDCIFHASGRKQACMGEKAVKSWQSEERHPYIRIKTDEWIRSYRTDLATNCDYNPRCQL